MTATITHKQPKQMANVAEFERWLAKKKTDYNYEFVEGKAIKKQPMKQNAFFIVSHLLDTFANTQAFKNKGKLLPEAGRKPRFGG